jgi:1,4-dihydroxy-2-naphthoate octaprenyltransferase/chlorophyll synthase
MSGWSKKEVHAWVNAAKVGSWAKTLMPTLLGLTFAARRLEDLIEPNSGIVLLYVLSLTTGMVFLNDYVDRDVDAEKRRIYPDSSLKTIPDALLAARSVLFAGVGCLFVAALLSVLGALLVQAWAFFFLGMLGIATFSIYSLPPFRLNYRGGGEICEVLGVGMILPLLALAGCGGEPMRWLEWPFWPSFLVLAATSAITSGLSDEVSDRIGGKQTVVVMLGNDAVRRMCVGAWFLYLTLIFFGVFADPCVAGKFAGGVILAIHVFGRRAMASGLRSANTGNLPAISRFKKAVNARIASYHLVFAFSRVVQMMLD